ncbi:MAG: FAD-dependent oxidoreductase [Candidatus Eremiobacteraeota bacterium]|nr:FAD-dependent oxidoreductase [Candidatus Eremiobacteraeota bacterium]MBC5801560.1 FAD-dependent oxidoreductase [Candidatus Eremiobacteraeota bacterium]MBC5821450.1 FAD-dependent oxidoreductase [Candidatus Eremiobacteraeota bacterium]
MDDVIVIGAGAAGLAAARRLAAQSLRVVVVEARERVGGRAWSVSLARAAVPAELGAEFIHGHAAETMALLREAGRAAIDTGGESWTFADGALRLRHDDDFVAAATIFKEASSLRDDESVDRFLQHFEGDGATRNAARAARSFAEGFDAADPELASARAIADEWQSGVDSVSARPLGGYRPMFEHLRSACDAAGVQMELSTRVRRIAWGHGDVRVVVDGRGMDSRTMRARAAIVTVPVGVLRHTGDESEIVFDPLLSAAKREALNSIEMGRVVRVVLSFRTAFWERICDGRYRDGAFFRSPEQSFASYWTQLPVRSELVVAWAGGPKATALAGLTQNDLIELIGAGAITLPTLAVQALFLLASAVVMMLFIGIHNAWDIVTYLAIDNPEQPATSSDNDNSA